MAGFLLSISIFICTSHLASISPNCRDDQKQNENAEAWGSLEILSFQADIFPVITPALSGLHRLFKLSSHLSANLGPSQSHLLLGNSCDLFCLWLMFMLMGQMLTCRICFYSFSVLCHVLISQTVF